VKHLFHRKDSDDDVLLHQPKRLTKMSCYRPQQMQTCLPLSQRAYNPRLLEDFSAKEKTLHIL